MLFLISAYSFKTDEMIYVASLLYRGIYREIISTPFLVFKKALAIQITPINPFYILSLRKLLIKCLICMAGLLVTG